MKTKKNTILIIGGTGFIGYNLAKKCIKKNLSVFSLSTSKPKKIRKLKKAKYLIGNIKSFCSLKKILKNIQFDFVVNCGGYVEHKDKQEVYNSHYRGCINLYNFFKNKNLKSFIQIGSSSEYGDAKIPHRENYLCKPKGVYGQFKLKSTNFLLEKYNKYSFPVTILRFYQLYGPHQDFNRFIPQLIRASINRERFLTSKGEQLRDFLFIDDAIDGIIKSISSSKSKGEIVNIGYGTAIKLKKIMSIVKRKNKFLNPDYGKVKIRTDEKVSVYPSIYKAKKKLNWFPKTSIKKGIHTTNKYYLKLLKKNNY